MKLPYQKWRKAAWLTALSFAVFGMAEAQRGVDPAKAPARASATIQRLEPAPIVLKPLPSSPALKLPAGLAADMSAWTKVTNGAIQGSPALIRMESGFGFLAVGSDGTLYSAPLTVSPSVSIDTSLWRVAAQDFGNGGVSCTPEKPQPTILGLKIVNCFGLGAGGSALQTAIVSSSGMAFDLGANPNLGGQNAAGLPTGIQFSINPPAYSSQPVPDNRLLEVVFVQADGKLWRRFTRIISWQMTNFGFLPSGTVADWEQIPGLITGSAPACVRAAGQIICVMRALGQFVQAVHASNDDALVENSIWAQKTNSATAPQSLNSQPAAVAHPSGRVTVVVRGADGKLMRTVYDPSKKTFSAWTDAAGYLREGTQPSCIADGEVPVCAIQGPDGAAYVRRLPSAIGL